MATWIDRTQTGGNRQVFTWSAWVKITGNLATYNHLATTNPNPGNWDTFRISNNRNFQIIMNDNNNQITTNRLFRDTNAWYHFVVAVDTTQATASNRVKLYVNGIQETSFSTNNPVSQNHNTNFNTSGQTFRIGDNTWSTGSEYFSGLMSHVHFIDGTAYDASTFGETDANGVWKIKTSPSVTYGTNGFFILKNGNSVTDQSGNSNNFTVGGGTLTKTEDNPSNVFATMNPLSPNDANGNFTNGNTSTNTGAAAWRTMFSTMGNSNGKYYCEMKRVSGSNMMFGVFSLDERNKIKNVGYLGDNTLGNRAVGLGQDGDYYINGSNSTYPGGSNTSWTTGDIIQIALDRDNNKVYFGKNGTWMGNGDPTSGATGTGAISFSTESHESWGFATSCYASTAAQNFGNGYFGTTAVASAGTNASGIGIFEYDVPTGYTALSTKGLNL
jgi:hypothetical protein